jgi:hypothetical protein
MLPTSTLTFADLYGSTPPGQRRGSNQDKDSANASGDLPASLETARPAIFWVALVGLLVIARLVWEYGGK